MSIPELINATYNRTDGELHYTESIKHFLQYFKSENEATEFVDSLFSQCCPIAALLNISLSSLGSLAANIISQTKQHSVFDGMEIISFIRRLLVLKSQRNQHLDLDKTYYG